MENKSIRLNDAQKQMLTQMLTWGEYCYAYNYFEVVDENGNYLTKSELKKHMKPLLDIGLVELIRGLMNDDGEVCGSGFTIVDFHREKIEKALNKHIPIEDILYFMENQKENEFIKNLATLYRVGNINQKDILKKAFPYYFESIKRRLQTDLIEKERYANSN